MTVRTRRTGTAVVALVTALGLAACEAPGSSSADAGGDDIVSATGEAPTGVTLTMWHSTADTPALLALYKRWEKESGNKIEFVDVPAATFGFVTQSKWATGARPDLLEWQGNNADALSLNMPKNAFALNSLPFVAKEGTLANLSGNVDGKVYAATLGPLLYYGVFYNKRVLADAGVDAPQTYADLTKACAALKAKSPGVTPLYEAGGSSFPPQALASFLYTGQDNIDAAYAEAVVKGTEKLDDPDGPFLAGLKAYDKLRTSGCFNSTATTATWPKQTQALLDGKAAMFAGDSNSIAQMYSQGGGDEEGVSDKIGFAAVSATKALANTSPNPVGTYYVPRTGDTTKERAAVDFITFVTSAKQYQAYVNEAGIIPTLTGTTTPDLTGLWDSVAKASQGAGLTLNSAIPGFGNAFGNESGKLLAGQETPQQVADKMQTYVKQALAATDGD
jgi:raffinose/stachyose/melibiose transport system substrate-binding protein